MVKDYRRLVWIVVSLVIALLSTSSSTADWPTYAHDAERSNVTDEALSFPLQRLWTYVSAQAPAPAWPEPVKNLNRTDFDYAPQPVMAGGMVYLGSSADDTVRALDAATGLERWHFITGGPVRFAPHIAHGRAYVASDDGHVYCLDAATGKPVWTFDAAPADEKLLGNGRMISRWPVRTGVLVVGDVAYCVAGMWAAEGVYIYALDAHTGNVLWCNDTSTALPLKGIHETFSLTGINPQGALLAGDGTLLVPMGRGSPAGFDIATGELRYYDPSNKTNGFGGTWLTIDQGKYYGYSKSFYSHLGIRSWSLKTGSPEARSAGSVPQHSTFYREKQYSLYDGKTCLLVHQGKLHGRLATSLAMAAGVLLVGEEGAVAAIGPDGGKELWRDKVEGQARGLAIADGRLVVTTDQGEIICYGSASGDRPAAAVHDPVAAPRTLLPPLDTGGVDRGYALVVGDADGRVSETLASRTQLHVIHVAPDQAAAGALRERLLGETKYYGSRIHVLPTSPQGRLPFAPYFANLVVVATASPIVPATELYRVLRPCGGIMLSTGLKPEQAESLLGQCGAPADEIQNIAGEPRVVRGRLPGALDWDTDPRIERRVKWPLRPIWFGGPGPAKMHSRKYRGPTLAFADGRYFVMGEGHVVAVDAYNGLELWSRPIPAQGVLNADADHVYLTLGGACVLLDPETGKEQKIYGPAAPAGFSAPIAGRLDEVSEKFRKWMNPGMDQSVIGSPRIHPLTLSPMPKVWLKAFGCSGMSCSATSVFTRSGTLGVYDFEDDSGMRNFGGIRPSCGQSTIAALGLWIVNEGSSTCECTYSFQTSLAFAPAERRLNEDWAVFYDWEVDSLVRQARINCGAPGDRRDDEGNLWIGFPRPATNERIYPAVPGGKSWLNIPGVAQQSMPLAIRVPMEVESFDGFGPYRVNADRIAIAGTDRPWIYASAYRGIRRATLKLDFTRPLISQPRATAPAIDGKLADAEWSGQPVTLPDSGTTCYFGHDQEHLYVAARRPPIIDRRGQVSPWVKTQIKDDGPVHNQDSWELFLSDAASGRVIHLGLSASGARYDSLFWTEAAGDHPIWNTTWASAVTADENGFIVEMAIPWKSLAAAGLDKNTLAINFQINRRWNIGEALMYLGFRGRDRCENFAPLGLGKPPEVKPREYSIRLHFAELDEVRPGERVFDVKLQGQTVLEKFDVVKEAGGVRRAVVRELEPIMATDAITLEFIPAGDAITPGTVPIINGIELR